MKKVFCLSAILLLLWAGTLKSQTLEMTPPVNQKVFGTSLIGVSDGLLYSLYSSNIYGRMVLTTYDESKGAVVATVEKKNVKDAMQFSESNQLLAFSGDGITNVFLEWKYEEYTKLVALRYDLQLNLLERKELQVISEGKDKSSYFRKPVLEKREQLVISAGKIKFAYRNADQVTVYDIKSLAPEKTVRLASKVVGDQMWVTDEGKLLFVDAGSKPATVLVSAPQDASLLPVQASIPAGAHTGYKFLENGKSQGILVVQTGSVCAAGRGTWSKLDALCTESISVFDIDFGKGALKNTRVVKLDGQLTEEFGKKGNVPFFEIQEMHAGSAGEVYLFADKHVVVEISNANGRSTEHHYDNIFLMKVNKDGSSVQKGIAYKGGAAPFVSFNQDRVVYLQQEEGGLSLKTELYKRVWDLNFEEKLADAETLVPYAQVKVNYNLTDYVKRSDGRVTFFGPNPYKGLFSFLNLRMN